MGKKKTGLAMVKTNRTPAPVDQGNLTGLNDVNPQQLIMEAISRNVPIDVLTKLLDMRDRLRREEAEKEFREAMSSFQADCPIIVKSGHVDYTSKKGGRVHYKYASLDVIVGAVGNIISKHGFSYRFTTRQTEKSITVICTINHIAGFSESTDATIDIDPDTLMNAAQTIGSTMTYAKRYSFCNGFGILTGEEDNDANRHAKQENTVDPIMEKLNALPENIKDGFRNLGYKKTPVVAMCEAEGWDNEKIYLRINEIIDRQAKS